MRENEFPWRIGDELLRMERGMFTLRIHTYPPISYYYTLCIVDQMAEQSPSRKEPEIRESSPDLFDSDPDVTAG